MRLAFFTLLLTLVLPGSTASVTVTGHAEASFDGHAYVMGFDGFTVMALATAPLETGSWQIPEGTAFDYVEVRLQSSLAPGTFAIGEQAIVTFQRWNADGEPADSYFADGGTLTLDAVEPDGAATGTLSGTLTGYTQEGEEVRITLDASFEATPENIPSP